MRNILAYVKFCPPHLNFILKCHYVIQMEEENRVVELELENHNLFTFGLCCTGNMFQLQKNNYIYIFGTIVTLLMLDSVVSWPLMMR